VRSDDRIRDTQNTKGREALIGYTTSIAPLSVLCYHCSGVVPLISSLLLLYSGRHYVIVEIEKNEKDDEM